MWSKVPESQTDLDEMRVPNVLIYLRNIHNHVSPYIVYHNIIQNGHMYCYRENKAQVN